MTVSHYFNKSKQGNHLHIYSSEDHLTAHNHPEIGSVESTSTWLFANLPPVDSIIIDGHTDHALQIPASLFTSLQRMNQAQKLNIFSQPSRMMTISWSLSKISMPITYHLYKTPMVKVTSLSHPIINNVLVAVFTAEDAAQRFLQAAIEKRTIYRWISSVERNYFTTSTCFLSMGMVLIVMVRLCQSPLTNPPYPLYGLQSTMSVFIQMQSSFQPSEAQIALQDLCASDIIPLDEVMHWIAKDDDPNAPDDSIERLDTLAAGIHLPNPSDTLDVVCRINQHLFHKHCFSGDTEDYYHPQNSLIHKVLARKKGLPIVLGVIYIEVAKRLDIEIQGIGFPRHFLISTNGYRTPVLHRSF